jgi:hypothetical protein
MESPHMDVSKSRGRSRITNGRRLLNNIDGRSLEARRYKDLLELYMAEFNVTTEAGQTLCAA